MWMFSLVMLWHYIEKWFLKSTWIISFPGRFFKVWCDKIGLFYYRLEEFKISSSFAIWPSEKYEVWLILFKIKTCCTMHASVRPSVRSLVCSFVPPFLRFIDPMFLRSFVPSSLRSFVPSFPRSFVSPSLRPFVPSFLLPFVPSNLRSIVPSFLRCYDPSMLRFFVPAFFLSFVPSFLRLFIYHQSIRLSVSAFVPSLTYTLFNL